MREFMRSADTAEREGGYSYRLRKLRNLADAISSLDLLAAPSTPPEVREEIIGRIEVGEPISRAETKAVKRVVQVQVTRHEMELPVIG
jgi:hypothetical protein